MKLFKYVVLMAYLLTVAHNFTPHCHGHCTAGEEGFAPLEEHTHVRAGVFAVLSNFFESSPHAGDGEEMLPHLNDATELEEIVPVTSLGYATSMSNVSVICPVEKDIKLMNNGIEDGYLVRNPLHCGERAPPQS